jgi:hypothetical protein
MMHSHHSHEVAIDIARRRDVHVAHHAVYRGLVFCQEGRFPAARRQRLVGGGRLARNRGLGHEATAQSDRQQHLSRGKELGAAKDL